MPKIDKRPVLLDLFCGVGGAADGYHVAGFEVVGVDINSQPYYPYEFVQADALEFLKKRWRDFDAVHASPSCQLYSVASVQDGFGRKRPVNPHQDLIRPLKDVLKRVLLPYVIENVVSAPLDRPVMLCGKMFNLQVARHRLFETGRFTVSQPDHPWPHLGRVITVAGNSGGSSKRDGDSRFGTVEQRHLAMGFKRRVPNRFLVEAIPPAYTTYVGEFLRRAVLCQR